MMRYLFATPILLIAIIFSARLTAQTATSSYPKGAKHTVEGMVMDSVSHAPVEFVSVAFFNTAAPDSLLNGTATGKSGKFQSSGFAPGSYKIRLTYVGYATVEKNIAIAAQSPEKIDVGIILLSPSDIMLDAVTIIAEVPEMQVREDTIEYNAAAFRVAEGAVAEDLLKRLPGIDVDTDGKITTAAGKTVKRVFVDGKEFFGSDPKMATKNLNVDMIDKVQVVEKQSDLAILTGVEDEDPETIINITIKKGQKKGWIGNVSAGIGNLMEDPAPDQSRYALNGNANRFSDSDQFSFIANANNINERGSGNRENAVRAGRGGRATGGIVSSNVFGINTANIINDRLKIGGNASYNYGDNNVTRKDNRTNFFEKDSTTYRHSNSVSRDFNNNLSLEAKVEYKPDTLTTVIFAPSISHNWSTSIDSSSQNTRINAEDGTLANESASHNRLSSKGTDVKMQLDLSRKLSKKGRKVSLSGSFNISKNNGTGENVSETNIYAPRARNTKLNQQSYSDADRNSYNIRFTYVEPIGKNYSLNVAYNIQNNETENRRSTFDYDSLMLAYAHLNPEYSKSSYNQSVNQNIRLNFRAQKTDYSYNIGINIAPMRINSKSFIVNWYPDGTDSVLYDPKPRNAVNFAPQLDFNYKLGDRMVRKNIRFRYNGSTRQPSINQLDPTPNTTNPLNIRSGNADLLASFNHNGSIEYNYNHREKQRSLTGTWNYSFVQNDIVNFTSYEDGIQHTMPINVNGSWNTGGTLLYSGALDKRKKLKFSTHTNASYRNQIGYTRVSKESQENISKTANLSESVSLSYSNDWFYGQLRGTTSYSHTRYSLEHLASQKSFRYNAFYNMQFTLPKSFSISTDIRYTANRGLSNGYNKDEVMWNAQFSKSFLKGNRGQIRLTLTDILRQRLNINRDIGANYLSDSETNALTSYFLLTFSYRMSAMGQRGGRSSGFRGRPDGE